MADYKLTAHGGIIRTADGATIPNDPRNPDRQRYEKWALGQAADPADAPPVVPSLSDLDAPQHKAVKAAMLVMATWNSKTPAQAKAAFKAAWDALP